MNRDVGRLWVKTLRSNRFKQGRGYLGGEAGHCCLGVLCELAVEAGVITRADDDRTMTDVLIYAYRGPSAVSGYREFLPPEVVEWAGLPNASPSVPAAVVPRSVYAAEIFQDPSLASLNDYGTSFDLIADMIEEAFLTDEPAEV